MPMVMADLREPRDMNPGKSQTEKWLTKDQNERVRVATRQYRQERGWSQTKMAEEMGMTQPSLSDFLNPSKNVGTTRPKAERLAALLGIEVEQLLGEEPKTAPDPTSEIDRAVRMARAGKVVSEEAIRFVLADSEGRNDQTWMQWLQELEVAERRIKRSGTPVPTAPLPGIDDHPMSPKGKKGRK